MSAREYSIPIGTPIRSCVCGVRICDVRENADKDAAIVTIEYSRGVNFEAWGAVHVCSGASSNDVSSEFEPLSPGVRESEKRGELRAAFCKGRNCGRIIYFRETESGKSTPVNADGTPHWATCPDAAQFKKPTSSTRCAEDEPVLGLWNGDNESPSEQLAARKAARK